MCIHCDIHRVRADLLCELAEKLPPERRGAHLEAAALHEFRIKEYEAIHAEADR